MTLNEELIAIVEEAAKGLPYSPNNMTAVNACMSIISRVEAIAERQGWGDELQPKLRAALSLDGRHV